MGEMREKFRISEEDIALYIAGELSERKSLLVMNASKKDPQLARYILKLKKADKILSEEFTEKYSIPNHFSYQVDDMLNQSFAHKKSWVPKIFNFQNLLAGGFGSAITASLFLVFGTSYIAVQTGPEIGSSYYTKYAQDGGESQLTYQLDEKESLESVISARQWNVSTNLAIHLNTLETAYNREKSFSGPNVTVKLGQPLRMSVVALNDMHVEVWKIESSGGITPVAKKTHLMKGQALSRQIIVPDETGEFILNFLVDGNLDQRFKIKTEE